MCVCVCVCVCLCVPQDIEVLMTALSSHQSQVLEELNLSYNSISDHGVEYIAEYIKVCQLDHIKSCTLTSLLVHFPCVDWQLSLEDIRLELH